MKQTIKLAGFGLAIAAIGFCLPIVALSQIPTLAVAKRGSISNIFYEAATLNSPVNPIRSTIHLEVSLSRRQVTVYRKQNRLRTYAIAIGQDGWETPTGRFQVKQLLSDPAWIHPLTNEFVPADDPRNPLGDYWIGFWTDGRNWIGFHGTPDPGSVGFAASHGCIRMYNSDIQELFQLVSEGTVVTVKP